MRSMAGPRDDHGIAGLNAMIMFIALLLSGSIIAAIIIASMAEVMQESKSDADKSQFALYGKVLVVDAHITKLEKNGDEIQEAMISITVELAPGSNTLQDQQKTYNLVIFVALEIGLNYQRGAKQLLLLEHLDLIYLLQAQFVNSLEDFLVGIKYFQK